MQLRDEKGRFGGKAPVSPWASYPEQMVRKSSEQAAIDGLVEMRRRDQLHSEDLRELVAKREAQAKRLRFSAIAAILLSVLLVAYFGWQFSR
jgi:hypothetical protein